MADNEQNKLLGTSENPTKVTFRMATMPDIIAATAIRLDAMEQSDVIGTLAADETINIPEDFHQRIEEHRDAVGGFTAEEQCSDLVKIILTKVVNQINTDRKGVGRRVYMGNKQLEMTSNLPNAGVQLHGSCDLYVYHSLSESEPNTPSSSPVNAMMLFEMKEVPHVTPKNIEEFTFTVQQENQLLAEVATLLCNRIQAARCERAIGILSNFYHWCFVIGDVSVMRWVKYPFAIPYVKTPFNKASEAERKALHPVYDQIYRCIYALIVTFMDNSPTTSPEAAVRRDQYQKNVAQSSIAVGSARLTPYFGLDKSPAGSSKLSNDEAQTPSKSSVEHGDESPAAKKFKTSDGKVSFMSSKTGSETAENPTLDVSDD